MRLAIVGKGGSGKTSIAGTMARQLARSGHRVLAIDSDANPNLALTLGIAPEAVEAPPTLTREMVDPRADGTARLLGDINGALTGVAEALESVAGPEPPSPGAAAGTPTG